MCAVSKVLKKMPTPFGPPIIVKDKKYTSYKSLIDDVQKWINTAGQDVIVEFIGVTINDKPLTNSKDTGAKQLAMLQKLSAETKESFIDFKCPRTLLSLALITLIALLLFRQTRLKTLLK